MIKYTKLYSNSFRVDIFIAQGLGGQFFYQTQCICIGVGNATRRSLNTTAGHDCRVLSFRLY